MTLKEKKFNNSVERIIKVIEKKEEPKTVTGGKYMGKTSKGFTIEQKNGIYYIGGVLIANKSYSLPKDYNPGGLLKEFKDNFEIINKHFKETFKELFKGGTAELKLTEPNNILETGVDIIASPPGKKLSSINLLSGGEKTLTAISLLFAIIKSKSSPFCVLDEVEAALDEANVDIFGKYLQRLKEKSEFIIITHKKKTMEYADILYGITMQESGVSKLVSVKLEDIE